MTALMLAALSLTMTVQVVLLALLQCQWQQVATRGIWFWFMSMTLPTFEAVSLLWTETPAEHKLEGPILIDNVCAHQVFEILGELPDLIRYHFSSQHGNRLESCSSFDCHYTRYIDCHSIWQSRLCLFSVKSHAMFHACASQVHHSECRTKRRHHNVNVKNRNNDNNKDKKRRLAEEVNDDMDPRWSCEFVWS